MIDEELPFGIPLQTYRQTLVTYEARHGCDGRHSNIMRVELGFLVWLLIVDIDHKITERSRKYEVLEDIKRLLR